MKTYKIVNYKGNIVESLTKFQEKYPKAKIAKAVEENGILKVTADVGGKEPIKEAVKSSSSDFVINNGVLEKYTGKGGDVVIPDGVTHIGHEAFWYCTGLTSVVIPKSVSSIGNHAFYACKNLKSVTMPDSVKEIGQYAFRSCRSITSITIPNGAKLGEDAFESDVLAIGKYGNVVCTGDSIMPYRTGVVRYKSIEWKSPGVYDGECMFYIASDGDFKMKCHYPKIPEKYPLSGHSDHGTMICQNVNVTAAENFVKRLFRKVESLSNVTWSELIDIVDKQVARFKNKCAKAGGNTKEHPWWYGTSDHMRD